MHIYYLFQLLWVRSRDLHIMSCNTMLFTADPRVSLQDNDGSFVLAIKKAQVSDTGRYECQLNTEPKMSLFFNLTVFGKLYFIVNLVNVRFIRLD